VTVSLAGDNPNIGCTFGLGETLGTLEVDSSVTTAGTVNWTLENMTSLDDVSGTELGPVANTISVTNPGNQTATVGTAVSLQMSASDSASGQTLTCSATGLPAGLSINSTSGLISGTPTTASTSNVTVTATDTTQASGNTSFTWTVVPPSADLSITNQAPSSVVSGNKLTYMITATNSGGQDASGVTVTDQLPGSFHFNSALTAQGTCTRPAGPKGGTVSCRVGKLAANGGSVTITIVVTATIPGVDLKDTATVSPTDATPGDNSAFATTTVIGT
jgi:uncharacterized repeat protein (TIGR01451 family)